MKFNLRYILIPAALLSAFSGSALRFPVSFSGSDREVIAVTPERNTGLDMVYVAYNANALTEMVITADAPVNVQKYSNMGGGYAQPVAVSYADGKTIVSNPEADMGYIIESGTDRQYVWLVNYYNHRLALNSLTQYPEQDCDNTKVSVSGNGEAITFYTIDGRPCELSRELELDYSNLEWDEDAENYRQVQENKTLSHLTDHITITPPLYCSSTFKLSGDRFLKQWGLAQTVESAVIQPNGLEAHTTQVQTNAPVDDPDAPPSNMIKTETQGLGGSAPADFEFRAFTTDAVIHNEWQIAADEQFEYINYRFNEQNLDYTFNEEGNYYVRFVGSNADGSCECYGDTYNITIGASDLRIPNAFSPNDDGVNDVWKVGFRSLLSFRCWIFDRYGNELYRFDDPTGGWDGKYKGKPVNPGVYFYVIEAEGADGQKYKKGGDINIIKSTRNTTGPSEGGEPAE